MARQRRKNLPEPQSGKRRPLESPSGSYGQELTRAQHRKPSLEEPILFILGHSILGQSKILSGLYRWNNLAVPNEMVEVGQLVPKGVFCLFSALAYCGLTTYVPHEYHLAIAQKEKVSLPDYPPIKVYFWSRQAQQAGVVSHTVIEGDAIPASIRMYEVEKTIADAVKYRHKKSRHPRATALPERYANHLSAATASLRVSAFRRMSIQRVTELHRAG